MERIYSIIKNSRVKKIRFKKGAWIYILNKKIKYYTKEILKYFNILFIAFGIIIAIILVKYKPIYEVKLSGEKIGYIQNKSAFEENIRKNILDNNTVNNIDTIDIAKTPEYELKLVDKTLKTNEEQVSNKIEENLTITYKYYEIALNNEVIDSVDTLELAEKLVNEIKEENKEKEPDLSIIEKYTQNQDEVKTQNIDIAKNNIQEQIKNANKKQTEQSDVITEINGIELATKPISGKITSRYGAKSTIRKSNHTGLDIAAPNGTPIKVVADGTVTNASYNGSYGNLVKINHGNGVETWYAHTSKMYVTVGSKVTAGQTIAAVGSTGNSTGSHLHFEIRINGTHINPQKYLYK